MPWKVEPRFYDRQCKQCGKSGLHRRAVFCSPRCFKDYQVAHPKTKRCEVCGLEFVVTKRWSARTCGKTCGGLLRRRRSKIDCLNCGRSFWKHQSSRSRKFCSHKCWAEYPNRKLKVRCPQCKKVFLRQACCVNRVKQSFCSKACAWKFNRGVHNPLYRGGNRHFRGADWTVQARRTRKRDKNTCQVCGAPKKNGEALTVDHIIAYRMFPSNDLRNLLSICRAPCHAKKTTTAEVKLLKGDRLGFLADLRVQGWPMDKVQVALDLFEQSPQIPLIQNGNGVAA